MKQVINRLAIDLNMSPEVVEKTYKAFWLYIKTLMKDFPLKEDLDEETFNKLRLNFNIPNLGKLACPYSRYLGVKKKYNLLRKR